jgi:hypothetical protein
MEDFTVQPGVYRRVIVNVQQAERVDTTFSQHKASSKDKARPRTVGGARTARDHEKQTGGGTLKDLDPTEIAKYRYAKCVGTGRHMKARRVGSRGDYG